MPLGLKLSVGPGFLSGGSVRRLTKRIFRRTINKYRCSFPNEIYALIFEHLTNDLSTLKKISLVCRDFAAMARPLLFRDIRLEPDWRPDAFLHPLVMRFWRLIVAHPDITDSVRTLQFSVYNMGPEERELRLDFILAHLLRLEEIWMDHPRIYHLQTVGKFFGNTLKELHCSDIILRTTSDFEIVQNMLNSLTALKVLVLNATIVEYAERPLILPPSLIIASFKRTDMALLRCVGLGLAMSSNPPILRVMLLDLVWYSNWHRWLEEFYGSQSCWNTLSINRTLVVLEVDEFVREVYYPRALITPMKDMRVSQVMLAFKTRSIALVSLLTELIPELPDTVHDICIDIDAHCPKSDTRLIPKRLRNLWLWLDSLLIRRYEQGLLTRIRFRCTSRTISFGYGGSFGKIFDQANSVYPVDRRILNQIEGLLPDSKRMGFLEVDHATKYFEHSL
ncbi:hypothetical protein GYMLUDRAFT_44524 [Collybiopsis luxurians FD-317 M1]|uniref:F-box domain-containing protein n=1 Tax=Collybiopsis luxurians FD-317 M1 TaxID=944289 RepID=A0A0D0CLW3_9AGAR|nr:hypothetical protein GYMLUDRAFT_44524 [Collybiopsis luxurians FD-317 M1]